MRKFKAIATQNSPAPQHVHATMFIKGETYKVSELPLIEQKVQQRMARWRSEAGGQSVLCDEIEDMVYETFYKEEKELEKYVMVEGRFKNNLGGSEVKEQSILRTTCKEFLQIIN